MEEVLSEILSAEKQAEELLAEARNQAQLNRQEFEKESSEKIASAKKSAQSIISESIETVKIDSERSRQDQITAALRKEEAVIGGQKARMDELAEKISAIIARTDTIFKG